MTDALQNYVRKFSRLRQGVTRFGSAPHKPVLLLAVIKGFEEGWIADNRIELSPELVATFKTLWQRLVQSGHSPLIAQPFFFMRGEGFWSHVPNPGYLSNPIQRHAMLAQSVRESSIVEGARCFHASSSSKRASTRPRKKPAKG